MAKGKKPNPVGRPKAIKDPQILWDLFVRYKEDAKANPFVRVDYVGKDGTPVDRKIERPLLIEGFACFVADNVDGINFPDIDRYLHDNKKGSTFSEFVTIAARIRFEIRQDQIAGGMAGVYNSSLTAKLNHLVDRQETKTVTSVQILNIDPLADPDDIVEIE